MRAGMIDTTRCDADVVFLLIQLWPSRHRRAHLLSKPVMADVMRWVILSAAVLVALVLSLSLGLLSKCLNRRRARARLSTPPLRDSVVLEIRPTNPASEATDSHIPIMTCQAYTTVRLVHTVAQGNNKPTTTAVLVPSESDAACTGQVVPPIPVYAEPSH